MNQDFPISQAYKDVFNTLKTKMMAEDGEFYPSVAINVMARTNTEKIKDLIDEDMGDYDKKKLKGIIERSIVKYVDIEE